MKDIEKALSENRYETARRLCMQALQMHCEDRNRILKYLHEAARRLGDFSLCTRALEMMQPTGEDERLDIILRSAEDFRIFSAYDFYRVSQRKARGYTYEEFQDELLAHAAGRLDQAGQLANTPARKRRVADALRRAGKPDEADALLKGLPQRKEPPKANPPVPQPAETGVIAGRITFPDGSPVAEVAVTLGLHTPCEDPPPDIIFTGMGRAGKVGEMQTLTAETDPGGCFRFDSVPAATHEFIAVGLDPMKFEIPTRFLAHHIDVKANTETKLDLVASEWHSAEPRPVRSPFTSEMKRGGVNYRRIHEETLKNPFCYHFPRQPVSFSLPAEAPAQPEKLLLLCSAAPQTPQTFQLSGDELVFFTDLPAMSDKVFSVYLAENGPSEAFERSPDLRPHAEAGGETAVIDTGSALFRIPWHAGKAYLPPLLSVRLHDGTWRGSGRLVLPEGAGVVSRTTRVMESGPLILTVEAAYELSNGQTYAIRFTAHRGESYLLAREISPKLDGAAFEFSLKEFTGGRGFLHWTPENGNIHWTDLNAQNRTLARLEESVPWWIPPEGFGYAMTPEGLAEQDYIAVFTIRRGEWIDREFEKICSGPGDDNRELDWPFPEMVGSTISMITAHTSEAGDAFFRFRFFDGERRWGILVSTLERNDGTFKEISAVQHKNSSPRLQEFKNWRLDEQDRLDRPSVVADRKNLIDLRKKKTSPTFSAIWQRICEGKGGPSAPGLKYALDGDPVMTWRLKKRMVAEATVRARMTLLGRDFSELYNPVGGRPITPWAEQYDLIVPSGVFTPEEERITRAGLMLMGHMYMQPDFMNWHFNSRNANFEADRVDIVGAIGLVFRGNPDADGFVRHAESLMKKSLEIYCTPNSGKWYENPPCYYLQAAKCRSNLAFHLASRSISDPTGIARLRDFLRWGVLLLTPPCPTSPGVMRNGAVEAEYDATPKARLIPPIGDHAALGQTLPDHYALMAKLYRDKDPEFADMLLWTFQQGGRGSAAFGNAPLMFAQLAENDLAPAAEQTLSSRRLQGFGAVFRGNFNRRDEFYMLLKLGPGGYRYHRTEGSIIIFADGKPLIYDGGEGNETWRHTTLSFHDVHMPLAPGHIERFRSFPCIDFAQGVHPAALEPGQPTFLSDDCRHELVELAYERFAETDPADSRSVTWVKDEYLILHDDLNLDERVRSFWHLQAVADSETGDWKRGYRFKGRFGVDLQVLLPGQEFTAASIERLPLVGYRTPPEERFATRHLALEGKDPDHYLAVLRPLKKGAGPLKASAIKCGGKTAGVHVTGSGIDDLIFLRRSRTESQAEGTAFDGRYGAVIRRPGSTQLVLLDGSRLAAGGVTVTGTGPAVYLRISKHSCELVAEGTGEVSVAGLGAPVRLELTGGRIHRTL